MVPTKQIEDVPPLERCCICRVKTFYWTDLPERSGGEQVAICQHCSSRALPSDIPTKDVWIRRERIAHVPSVGEVARGQDLQGAVLDLQQATDALQMRELEEIGRLRSAKKR